MIAEKNQADPDYIIAANPTINWDNLRVGDVITAPLVPPVQIRNPIDHVRIHLNQRTLKAIDASGATAFHCPVSIAREVEKRPLGSLTVKVLVEAPNYTFNPAILSATARPGRHRQEIHHPARTKQPSWLGLDRARSPELRHPRHPRPRKVGRTESSGCFRLANWNARASSEHSKSARLST